MATKERLGKAFTKFFSIGGVRLYPADLRLISGMGAANQRVKKVAKVALGATDTGGGVLTWQNPESGDIVINRLTIVTTTKSTGASTVDFGTTATSATTSSDNLLDGADLGTATVTTDNVASAGTNGKGLQKLAAGKWVTGSRASGAAAGLVGYAYIEYFVL